MAVNNLFGDSCSSQISGAFRVYDQVTLEISDSSQTSTYVGYELPYSASAVEFDISSAYTCPGSRTQLEYLEPFCTIWTSNITTITTGRAIADPVVIGWQMKDMSEFPSAYASSLAFRIGVTLETSSSSPSPMSSSNLPQQTSPPLPVSSSGLSTGAKIGIGLGVEIGVLVLFLVIVISPFLRRRRRKRRKTTDSTPASTTVHEMEDQDKTLAARKWFLFGRWRSEHAGEERRHELGSRTVNVVPGPPVEMDTGEQVQYRQQTQIETVGGVLK
jgi:hypothetical protein